MFKSRIWQTGCHRSTRSKSTSSLSISLFLWKLTDTKMASTSALNMQISLFASRTDGGVRSQVSAFQPLLSRHRQAWMIVVNVASLQHNQTCCNGAVLPNMAAIKVKQMSTFHSRLELFKHNNCNTFPGVTEQAFCTRQEDVRPLQKCVNCLLKSDMIAHQSVDLSRDFKYVILKQ